MSAAEKFVQFDAMYDESKTRGYGSLADCPLARMYKWTPPIQDYVARRYPVEERRALSLSTPVSYKWIPLSPSTTVHPTPSRLNAVRAVVRPPKPKRRRRSAEEVAVVVAAYVELCAQPYARGDLKAFASKHGYASVESLTTLLMNHGVWKNRRDVGSAV